jgi:hypothetical protein
MQDIRLSAAVDRRVKIQKPDGQKVTDHEYGLHLRTPPAVSLRRMLGPNGVRETWYAPDCSTCWHEVRRTYKCSFPYQRLAPQ